MSRLPRAAGAALALLLLALALAGVATPAGAAPIRVSDDRGRSVTLPAAPQRIVSLLPSLTETVCALGACARLVGVDRFSDWPAEVQALPRLGGLEDAQLERIVALKPDVVFAAASARVLDRLEALGVRVLALEPRSLADTHRVIGTVAAALGMPEAAEPLWARIEARIEAAAARVPAALRGKRVYFEVASAPYAAGTVSFIGETLARLGLGNIVPPELGPFPKLNPEFVVRARPDIVMATARSIAEMHHRPGWSAIPALRAGRVCGFAAGRYELLVRPGPRLGEAAELMADCLAALDNAGAASTTTTPPTR